LRESRAADRRQVSNKANNGEVITAAAVHIVGRLNSITLLRVTAAEFRRVALSLNGAEKGSSCSRFVAAISLIPISRIGRASR
jgi:hypothetical protein